jgi:hypothetical protein
MGTPKTFLCIIVSYTRCVLLKSLHKVSPRRGAAPNSLNFGSVTVGSTISQTFKVNNTGIAPVTILQATVTGAGFGVSGPSLPLILVAGQSATFNATFTPAAGVRGEAFRSRAAPLTHRQTYHCLEPE